MSKRISARLNDDAKPKKNPKCRNETPRQANELFSNLAENVVNFINRSKVITDMKNKETKRLYTDLTGKYVRIVEIIIKTQSNKLCQVAKSDENNFLYDVHIRVSNDNIKKGDCFRRRWVTWFHLRKSDIVKEGLKDKNRWIVCGA